MKPSVAHPLLFLCLVFFWVSCHVKRDLVTLAIQQKEEVEEIKTEPEKTEPLKKSNLLKHHLVKIAVENAHDVYRWDSIKLNVPLFIYQLDAKFTHAKKSFTVRVDNYEATKITADSVYLNQFTLDSTWHSMELDSAAVEVTCIYEITGIYKRPLPGCMKNSYIIRAENLTNNLDYKLCY